MGETNFHTREIPRSGSKAKDGERERKEERLNVGNNNGQKKINLENQEQKKFFLNFDLIMTDVEQFRIVLSLILHLKV